MGTAAATVSQAADYSRDNSRSKSSPFCGTQDLDTPTRLPRNVLCRRPMAHRTGQRAAPSRTCTVLISKPDAKPGTQPVSSAQRDPFWTSSLAPKSAPDDRTPTSLNRTRETHSPGARAPNYPGTQVRGNSFCQTSCSGTANSFTPRGRLSCKPARRMAGLDTVEPQGIRPSQCPRQSCCSWKLRSSWGPRSNSSILTPK
jgi:hypothetical protein